MLTRATVYCRVILWVVVLAVVFAPAMILGQADSTATTGVSAAEGPLPNTPPNTNPTQRLIYPRKQQSDEQQLSDELECYEWTCEQIDWDPYEAYAYLVDEGYAVALTREEMEMGLIGAATRGAVVGAVAGEIVGRPHGGAGNGAEIGAAIAIALELIHSNHLYEQDAPEAQRTITRFERNLRKWDRKFAGCMKRKGYRVPSS